MSKGDFPALRMIVDGGRLAPATPFDAERLNSYRRGTVVFCKFTEEKDRVLVRKWFAIIGLVLKQCETPWKNKDEAHEAIKLALGIVNLSKTVSGQWMQYPKSLAELADPELQEALEQMIALLSHMTGVDVETLRKEAADVGREIEQPNSDDLPSSSEDAEDAALSSAAAGGADSPSTPPAATLSDADLGWLRTVATMLWSATHPGRENLHILETQKMCVPNGKPFSEEAREKARRIYEQLEKVPTLGHDKAGKRGIVANIAGISEKELSDG